MTTGEDYLFVYGTLRAACGHPLHRVLRRHGEFAGIARYAGALYDVGPYPAIVPAAGIHPPVTGELYRLRNADALWPILDRYEGCTDSPEGPAEYRRERAQVIRAAGDSTLAWLYLYNRPIGGLRRIASGDYLQDPQARRLGRQS